MENLPHTNMAELLISSVCLAVLVPVKEINTRFRQRLRTPIPVEILTVSQQDLGINSGCSTIFIAIFWKRLGKQCSQHLLKKDWTLNVTIIAKKVSQVSISYGPTVSEYCFLSVRQLYFFFISLHKKTNIFPHIRFQSCICDFANFVTSFSHGSCIIRQNWCLYIPTVYNLINNVNAMFSCLNLQVIIATGVTFAFSLDTVYNIEIVGHIPAG